ncbi:MAG TPA: hypothetical protein VKZ51_00240 [Cyclobacteriaceae bacterium]|nr:hypothetical protein [Cyclobacteriaceae bacterium]
MEEYIGDRRRGDRSGSEYFPYGTFEFIFLAGIFGVSQPKKDFRLNGRDFIRKGNCPDGFLTPLVLNELICRYFSLLVFHSQTRGRKEQKETVSQEK